MDAKTARKTSHKNFNLSDVDRIRDLINWIDHQINAAANKGLFDLKIEQTDDKKFTEKESLLLQKYYRSRGFYFLKLDKKTYPFHTNWIISW